MKYTRQTAFDAVKKHLLTQMEKSKSSDSCLYRGPGGLKCAIGALIPDDVYKPEMDVVDDMRVGQSIRELIVKFPEVAALFPKISPGFLVALQGIHDLSDTDHWKFELKNFAIEQRLDYGE